MSTSKPAADRAALSRLAAVARVPLIGGPTPVEEMARLRAAIGIGRIHVSSSVDALGALLDREGDERVQLCMSRSGIDGVGGHWYRITKMVGASGGDQGGGGV